MASDPGAVTVIDAFGSCTHPLLNPFWSATYSSK